MDGEPVAGGDYEREPYASALGAGEEVGWELIRCPGCGREHTRRRGAMLVLACVTCGGQREVYRLRLAGPVAVRPLGSTGSQVLAHAPDDCVPEPGWE
jgi:hypothetical protein